MLLRCYWEWPVRVLEGLGIQLFHEIYWQPMKPHLVICSSSRECGECIKPYTKKDCFHSFPSKKRMETEAERAMRTPESFDLLEYFGMLVKLHGRIWNSIKNTHESCIKIGYIHVSRLPWRYCTRSRRRCRDGGHAAGPNAAKEYNRFLLGSFWIIWHFLPGVSI
jgi:hypothetical protein